MFDITLREMLRDFTADPLSDDGQWSGAWTSILNALFPLTQGYVPKATDRNALEIAGYRGEFPSPDDLALFMNEFRTDGEDATFTVVNGGGYDPANPGFEANLDGDIQYNDVDIPQAISTSYGGYEHDMSREYMDSVCTLFGQLGLRGVGVLFSSGDDGAGDGDCLVQSNSGEQFVQFLPIFPATCPWVTSVGGTTGHDPEVAASISGGGFSISGYFPRQPYQADAISTFLQNFEDKYSGLYDPLGCGFPDVSSQAIEFVFVLGEKFEFVTDTSGSVPTVAGIISLLNDYLISKGSTPLGFLNPWLYGTGPPGLNDIRSGSNPGCNTDGFPAVAEWDPVTGLGTLDFEKLEEIIDDRLRTLKSGYLKHTKPST
ncbi:peptidase S8/S53 domain-containing protein [Lactarius deliciosus]|nr:peptidase S8/S53 domain-containing protein [Lactarius deliciosus]